ncbi:Bifunctional inhibitor/plant lipid transfer protein/seed storage helical domain [Dillenia turbinata]|uniref:Bifunctional inhibitor/plant lipid transfer protein/seed storage helical domain n=1 Tax=Dillenia turbinata TaxID=194707 RepID=A0AAN8WHP3_9MAGN
MEAYTKLFLVAMVLAAAMASGPYLANAEGGFCRMTREGLTSCMPFVSGDNPPPPSPACCVALANADFKCLCSYKASNLLPAFGINPNAAMDLPMKCNLLLSFHC